MINRNTWYNIKMKKQILLETNPYLQDPKVRKRLIAKAIKTSCEVEGIDIEDNVKSLRKIAQNSEKRIFKVGGMLSGRVAK